MSINLEEKQVIAQILKEQRIVSGYTQKVIGKMLDKAPQTVASWESGKGQPDISTFILLCYQYGITDIMSTFFPDNIQRNQSIETLLNKEDHYDYEDKGISEKERNLLINYRKLDDNQKILLAEILSSVLSMSKIN